MKELRINATECSLVDTIYNGIDFRSNAIKPYLSRQSGDGGLSPGKLLFRENLEDFSKKSLEKILSDININNCFIKKNISGASSVAFITASQIIDHKAAVIFGNCTGASACFHLGGMLQEKNPGEKLHMIEQIFSLYGIHS